MGIAERKLRQKEGVRASVLEAAWHLVEEDGWQALSIRKIAEAIEYSAPVIYDHFENKEAILLEFTRRGFRLLSEKLETARNTTADPATQIEAMAYAYWHFAFDQKEYYQLMYGLGMPSCETVKRIDEINMFSNLILDVIRRLVASGNNPAADPYIKLHMFWSMLHGTVSINMMEKGNTRNDLNKKVLQDFIQSFLAGIIAG